MKKFAMFLAVVSVVGLAHGIALAADAEAPTTKGTVVKVDGKTLILKVASKDKDGKETTQNWNITTNDKTAVTLDGKDAKLADLKEGMAAVVTYVVPKDGLKAGATPAVGKVAATSAN